MLLAYECLRAATNNSEVAHYRTAVCLQKALELASLHGHLLKPLYFGEAHH